MKDSEGELELEDYLSLLQRRWRWIAGAVLVITGLVGMFTLTQEEVYESKAEIQILTEENCSVFNNCRESLFRQPLAELQFLSGRQYDRRVEQAAGVEVEVIAEIRPVSTAEVTAEAGVIRFTVLQPTAQRAADGATAAVEIYLSFRHNQEVRALEDDLEDENIRLDSLQQQRTSLEAPLIELEGQLRAATTAEQIANLEAAINLLRLEIEPQQINLTTEIGNVLKTISDIENTLRALENPEAAAILLNPAETPTSPVSPNVPRNILIGVVVGMVMGIILAIMRDLLDTRARDGAELAQLVDIPVMATISEIRPQRSAPGRVRRYRDLSEEESSGYKVLLNSLWLSNVDEPLQSLVLTSDRPGVGKTQTVVNLAQAEAARGTRVLVIDTDFINASVAERLDLPRAAVGLGHLLEGSARPEDAIVATGIDNLDLIDAVGEVDLSGALLRSDRLRALLEQLYSGYDLIVLDSPPTLSTADSRLVATQSDAVVLVYDPAHSRRDELQRTIDLLRGARANLIGLVANRSRASHPVYLSAKDR